MIKDPVLGKSQFEHIALEKIQKFYADILHFQIIFTVTQLNTWKFKTVDQQILNQECDSRWNCYNFIHVYLLFPELKNSVWNALQKVEVDTKTSYIFRNFSKMV